jgi:hypothetical protein
MQQAQGSRSVTDDASSVGSMRSVIDVQPRAYELIDVDVWLLQKGSGDWLSLVKLWSQDRWQHCCTMAWLAVEDAAYRGGLLSGARLQRKACVVGVCMTINYNWLQDRELTIEGAR